MSDENLKVNSLSRFTKSSRNLVLREYSNCEVPAGCGGVVFRWKKPDNPVPFEMLFYIVGNYEVFLDGNQLQSTCPVLERGEHVLSFIISDYEANYGILLFSGRTGEIGFYNAERKFYGWGEYIVSAPDSSWKYLATAPEEKFWTGLKFDDSNWRSMIYKDLSSIDEQDSRQFQIRRLSMMGAQSLGIEEAKGNTIWIRKKFSL